MVLVKKWRFSNFFFKSNLDQENFFYDILERVNVFLRCKNKESKNSKNWHFSKGVNPWFWSKNGYFVNFFFLSNFGQENFFLRYSRSKKPLSRLSEKEVQKVEKLTFSQGVNPWFWSKNGDFSNFFF